MKTISRKLSLVLVLAAVVITSVGMANAQSGVPDVNLSQEPTADTPWGAFKLLQCDGPDYSNLKKSIKISYNGQEYTVPIPGNPPRNPPGYIPCNFEGLMIQMQFLINAAMVLGVVAALIGFAWAGFLYITGTQENIKKAKSIFPKILIGFIIMLAAWTIVYQILRWLTPEGSAYLQ